MKTGVYKAHMPGSPIDSILVDGTGRAFGVKTSGVLNILSAWEASTRLDAELFIERDTYVSGTVSIDTPTVSRRKVSGSLHRRRPIKVELDHILALGTMRGEAAIETLVSKRRETRKSRNTVNDKIGQASCDLKASLAANTRNEVITRITRDTALTICMMFGPSQVGLFFNGAKIARTISFGSRVLTLSSDQTFAFGAGLTACSWVGRAAARMGDVALTENTTSGQMLAAGAIDLAIGGIQQVFAFIPANLFGGVEVKYDYKFLAVAVINFFPNAVGRFLSAVSDEVVSNSGTSTDKLKRVAEKTSISSAFGLFSDFATQIGLPIVAAKVTNSSVAAEIAQSAADFALSGSVNTLKEVSNNAMLAFAKTDSIIRSALVGLEDPNNDREFVTKNCMYGPLKVKWP